MTRIMYVGDSPEAYVVALDGIVPHGVAIDVDDDIAAALLEQPGNWQPADTKKTTTVAPAGEED